MKCVLFKCVNSVHIKMAHDGMNCYFFFCLILSASWSVNILFTEFVENRSFQQRLGVQVTAADYFQTRLPVAFLCTALVLVILQLWCWTYLHFQILKAQEMSTPVPKKWSIFFFSMTLSLTYLYPLDNLLFLQVTKEGRLVTYDQEVKLHRCWLQHLEHTQRQNSK